MPQFLVCAHTCPHVETRFNLPFSKRLSERGYILWSDGGTYTSHKSSKALHSQCAPPCNPRSGFQDVSDALWARYANKVYDAYGALDEEGNHTKLWPKQKKAIPQKYLTKSRGGFLDSTPEPLLEPGPSRSSLEVSPEPSAEPSPSPLDNQTSAGSNAEETPIWPDVMKHSASDQYKKFLNIAYIENTENRQESRESSLQMLTYCVPPLDLDEDRFTHYLNAFPQLVFDDQEVKGRRWFEWVISLLS